MSGKSLSTGTLSLRFMQNAHRAKQIKEVELERAEVKDDGRWEVAQTIRDAWGLSSTDSAIESDVHEPSYLPFLFSSTSPAANESPSLDNQPKGRRVFGRKGEEAVKQNSSSGSATLEPAANAASLPDEPHKGRKIHPRPVSVTASGPSGHLRGFDQFKIPRQSTKSAKQAIFETGGVGTDLRPSGTIKAHQVEEQPKNDLFLKPAGVDEPSRIKRPKSTNSSISVIDGAREKKAKRKRNDVPDQPTDAPKKQKKETKKDPR